MEKIDIISLKPGYRAEGNLLLTSVEEKLTRNGKPYIQVNLTDGKVDITAKQWDTTKASVEVLVGCPVRVGLICREYNGANDYNLDLLMAGDAGVKVTDFVRKAPLPSEKMYNEILADVRSTVKSKEGTLVEIVERLYEKNKVELMKHGAAKSVHHGYYGGLLYHTYRMIKTAKALLPVYPSLNAELLLSAIALHDIGKLKELDTDDFGKSDYSIDGQLFGHLLIGIEMIDEEARNGEYNPEMLRMLKHCVASHHGELDFGAITVPHVKEASVLHTLDILDSRIEIFESTESLTEPGSLSAEKVFAIGNIPIYKPGF